MFVTSFSQDGYTQYGKKFLETYTAHSKIPITVYFEGVEPDFEHDLVSYIDLFKVPGTLDFLFKIKGHDLMRGLMMEQELDEKPKQVYNYRRDAFKFCRKVFVLCDFVKIMGNETFAWIDADVIVLKDLPANYLQNFTDKKRVRISYLGRRGMHSECGFMVFYKGQSRDMKRFWKSYRDLYTSGAFVHLAEWHDCFMFDHSRLLNTIKTHNISADVEEENLMHPWCHTVLAEHFDHLKGARKEAGISPEHPRAQEAEND